MYIYYTPVYHLELDQRRDCRIYAWEGGKKIEETQKYTSFAEKKSLHLIMAYMHKIYSNVDLSSGV